MEVAFAFHAGVAAAGSLGAGEGALGHGHAADGDVGNAVPAGGVGTEDTEGEGVADEHGVGDGQVDRRGVGLTGFPQPHPLGRRGVHVRHRDVEFLQLGNAGLGGDVPDVVEEVEVATEVVILEQDVRGAASEIHVLGDLEDVVAAVVVMTASGDDFACFVLQSAELDVPNAVDDLAFLGFTSTDDEGRALIFAGAGAATGEVLVAGGERAADDVEREVAGTEACGRRAETRVSEVALRDHGVDVGVGSQRDRGRDVVDVHGAALGIACRGVVARDVVAVNERGAVDDGAGQAAVRIRTDVAVGAHRDGDDVLRLGVVVEAVVVRGIVRDLDVSQRVGLAFHRDQEVVDAASDGQHVAGTAVELGQIENESTAFGDVVRFVETGGLVETDADVLDVVGRGDLGILVDDQAEAGLVAVDRADRGLRGRAGELDAGQVRAFGVADSQAADGAAVDEDGGAADAGHVVRVGEDAAGDGESVITGRLGNGRGHVGLGVDAVVQQVGEGAAVNVGERGAGDVGIRVAGIDVDVARVAGDQPEVAVAEEPAIIRIVDDDVDVVDVGLGQVVGVQDDLARAFVVAGGQNDRADGGGVEGAVDRQAAVAVDEQRVDQGDVAADMDGALNRHVVEVGQVGIQVVRAEGHEQSAGAAGHFASTVDLGEDRFFRDVAFVVDDRGHTVGAARDLDRGVAGEDLFVHEIGSRDDGADSDVFVIDGDRAGLGEVAVGHDHVDVAFGNFLGFQRAVQFAVEVRAGAGHDQLVAFREGQLGVLELGVRVRDGETFRAVDEQHIAERRGGAGLHDRVIRIPVDVADGAVEEDDGVFGLDELVSALVHTDHVDLFGAGDRLGHVDERLARAGVTGDVDVDHAAGGGHLEDVALERGILIQVDDLEPEGPEDTVVAVHVQDLVAGVLGQLVATDSVGRNRAVHGRVLHVEREVRRAGRGTPLPGALGSELEVVVGRGTEFGILDRDDDRAGVAGVAVHHPPPLVARGSDVLHRPVDGLAGSDEGVAHDFDVVADDRVDHLELVRRAGEVEVVGHVQGVVVVAADRGTLDDHRHVAEDVVVVIPRAAGRNTVEQPAVAILTEGAVFDVDVDVAVRGQIAAGHAADDHAHVAVRDVQAQRAVGGVVVAVAAVDVGRRADDGGVGGGLTIAERVDAVEEDVAVRVRRAGDFGREARIEVDAVQGQHVEVIALLEQIDARVGRRFDGVAAGGRDDLVQVGAIVLGGTGDLDRAAFGHFDGAGGNAAGSVDDEGLDVLNALRDGNVAGHSEGRVAGADESAVHDRAVFEGDRSARHTVGTFLSGHFDAADGAVADRDGHVAVVFLVGGIDHALERAAGEGEVRAVHHEVAGIVAAGDREGVGAAAETRESGGAVCERVEAVLEVGAVGEDGAGGGFRVRAVQERVGRDRRLQDDVVVDLDHAELVLVLADDFDIGSVEAGEFIDRGDDHVRTSDVTGHIDRDGAAGQVEIASQDHAAGRDREIGAGQGFERGGGVDDQDGREVLDGCEGGVLLNEQRTVDIALGAVDHADLSAVFDR